MQPGVLTLAILLATLFGGLFGLIYLRTGSLWFPIAMHFAWNFVENDVLNLSADGLNPNLIGALTRLHDPLTLERLSLSNVVVLEGLAFAVIAAGAAWWLQNRRLAKPA